MKPVHQIKAEPNGAAVVRSYVQINLRIYIHLGWIIRKWLQEWSKAIVTNLIVGVAGFRGPEILELRFQDEVCTGIVQISVLEEKKIVVWADRELPDSITIDKRFVEYIRISTLSSGLRKEPDLAHIEISSQRVEAYTTLPQVGIISKSAYGTDAIGKFAADHWRRGYRKLRAPGNVVP